MRREGRPSAARRGPGQARLFRICFYAVMGLCLLGGLINGIRAYYLIFFFQLMLVAISLCLNLWTVLSFAYVQRLDERRAVKGGLCTLHLGIYNDKPFPFTMMRVHVDLVSGEQMVTLNLMPLASQDEDLPVLLPYRGVYQVGMSVVEINDIFGILPMKFDMRRLSYYRQLKLTVYPNLIRLSAMRPAAGDEKSFAGVNLTAAPEGDSFAQVRQYRPGDSGKRIHWKLFAGRRALYTRQYEVPSEARTLVLIANTAHEGEEGLRYADVCCECAAALAYYSLGKSYPVHLIQGNGRYKPVTALTMPGFWPLYDWLATLPFDASAGDLAQTLHNQLTQGTQVRSLYVLADALDEKMRTALSAALVWGVKVTWVRCQPSEGSMPSLEGMRTVTARYGEDLTAVLEKIV